MSEQKRYAKGYMTERKLASGRAKTILLFLTIDQQKLQSD